jgi:hypothetical protein
MKPKLILMSVTCPVEGCEWGGVGWGDANDEPKALEIKRQVFKEQHEAGKHDG